MARSFATWINTRNLDLEMPLQAVSDNRRDDNEVTEKKREPSFRESIMTHKQGLLHRRMNS